MASCCAPLHSRSSYSLLRGSAPIDRLVIAVRDAGYEAIALTDRNNLYGAVPFVTQARAAGLEPILGVELDEPERRDPDRMNPHPVVVLARGATGYRTLCRLITRRHLDPEFTLASALAAEHEDVHVVTSGAPALESLRAVLPRERLWVEVNPIAADPSAVPHGIARARSLGLRPLSTAPIAHLAPEDVELARLLTAARTGVLAPAVDDQAIDDPESILRPPGAHARRLAATPDLLAANRELAAECRAELPASDPVFPVVAIPPGETAYSRLLERGLTGIRWRYGALVRAPVERLMRELAVIAHLGFAEYFLVVGDIVAFARERGIPVVGRGSGASSIVAYVLGITNVDPIAYRLHFERFLSAERGADLPDLDVDLDWRGRDEVIDHVYRTHGADRVAMISTHAFFHPRSAFREAARAHGVPVAEVNRLARFLPHEGDDLEAIVRAIPGLRELSWESEPWRSILAGADRFLGLPRHLGIHPGGLVIAPGRLDDRVALERATKGIVVTQYEMEAVAAVGLVKIDLLGNRALSTLREAVRLAEPVIDLDHPIDSDPSTARLLAAGDTLGCFQIESPGMRNLLEMLGSGSVRAVVEALSLIRPGPASSGMKERFIRRAHRLEALSYAHPGLEAVIGPTLGIPLYEEDVMGMAHAVAGMSLERADQLRRAIAGARTVEEMRALKNGFVAEAVHAGVEPDQAVAVWEEMARFAAYSFSRAHAAGYGLLAYQSAYLKAHAPEAFACAVLNNHQGMYPLWVHVEDARRHGVRILLPSIERSETEFTLESRAGEEGRPAVRTGLGQVQGLSEATIAALLAARRESGPARSLRELWVRVRPSRAELETLIRVGALDDLGKARSELLWQARELAHHREGSSSGDQTPAHAGQALFSEDVGTVPAPRLRELAPLRRLADELEGLGISPRAHPLCVLAPESAAGRVESPVRRVAAAELRARIGERVAVVGVAAATRRTPTRSGDTMAFLTLDDPSGMAECTLFPAAFRRHTRELVGSRVLLAAGRVEEQFGAVTLNVERLHPVDALQKDHAGESGTRRILT